MPASLLESLIIESLGQAIRSLAFFVPGGYGVQEGGYVLIGGLFGIPPQAALALSLVKRARELSLGVPALLGWLNLERKGWTHWHSGLHPRRID